MKKFMLLCLTSLMTTLMWSQAFVDENFSGGVLPAGWTNNDLDGGGGVWLFDNPNGQTANSPISAPFAIIDSDYYGSGETQDAALETPPFDASTATGVILDFDYYHRQCCGATMYVEVFNGASWVEVHSESSQSTNPAHLTLDITTTLNGATNAQVRFRYTGEWDWYWIIDNVKIAPPPSCLSPSDLVVASVASNTADISWTAGDTETDWNISWGTPGYTPGLDDEGTDIVSTTPAYQITSLDANTEYEFYVQADCGGDESTWTGPVSFTTACLAADLPFTQDFESVTTPNIPDCASLEVNNGYAWTTTSTSSYGFNGKVLRYSYHSGGDADSWYFTQGINLNAGVDYQISYQYGNNSTSYTENLKVAYGLSANSAAMTEDIADHTISLAGSEENEATFNVASDGIYYFGFQSHSISGQYYMYVDNINVNTAPLCTAPTLTLAAQDASGDPITCLDAGGEYFVLATLSGGDGNTSYNVSANSGTSVEVTADASEVFGPFARGTDVSI